MVTLMFLVGGFVLLFFCQLVARAFAGAGVNPMANAMLIFIPLWLVVTAVAMWLGMSQVGHSLMSELPTFLLVFGVPVTAAVLTWWRLTHLRKNK